MFPKHFAVQALCVLGKTAYVPYLLDKMMCFKYDGTIVFIYLLNLYKRGKYNNIKTT